VHNIHLFFRKATLVVLFTIGFSISHAQRFYYDDHLLKWIDQHPPDNKELLHSIVLIGDVINPSHDSTVMQLLKGKLEEIKDKGSLIFLGDIVYPKGLPDEESGDYTAGKSDLNVILFTVKDFKGNIIFMPGNHDWQKGDTDGWNHVKNAEAYIHEFLGRENVYLPGDGCPGPVEVHLSDDVVAIVFDTQWWFHKHEKPGPDDGCDFEDEAGLFVQIEDIIRRNKEKKILFAAHHPLFSVGNHGGFFPASRLLFPLLDLNKNLYIPLPGFIYTWYRKYLGHIQDLSHPEYKILRQTLLKIFDEYPDVIYASGHEHNLQFFEYNKLHHIVSGGGGEGTYIAKKKKKTDFAMASRGFSILHYYQNGDVWVEYWVPGESPAGNLVFRHKLFNKPVFDAQKKKELLESIDFSDSIVQVKLSDIYSKGKFVRFWMGDNYRAIWNLSVELPVFDIGAEKGGLTILKRGGGQQTRSVRMEDKAGKQYVLRSVNKYVEKALEVSMRNTIAEDVVQDAISASHPFAAMTIPALADAAGVMHANPKIVWVPDDPRLGSFRKDLANDIFLFEERPAGNRDDVVSFGSSEKIVNTGKVVEKTQQKHDHKVDQNTVVRARIFDLFLNDWDRHDDQWRWASFKEGDDKVYRPIPRDRDQVYFVNEGVIMWLARQDFVQPKFQGFDYKIKNVKGLGFNARYFDRAFITEPDMDYWKKTAAIMQKGITDSVIHVAISSFPKDVYAISGMEIEDKLKSRREKLDKYAEGLYRFLAKEVDVVGTDERELFQVKRLENGNTEVTVLTLSKKRGKIKDQLYHREFHYDETKEIRLYGLKGKDKFEISGTAPKAINIRLIGGKNNDSIIDNSRVKRPGKTLLVYDRKDKNNYIRKGKETKLKLSRNKSVNVYDRKQYKYDKTSPILGAGFNHDDGFFIGGGVNIKRYNFRDSTSHKINGTFAFQTKAFSVNYEGLYSSFSQFFDMELIASLSMPRNVDNYFGLGNETKRLTDDRTFYRVRYAYALVNPMLKHTINRNVSYKFGAFYQYFNVNDTAGRYIGNTELNMLDSLAYIEHHFTGLNIALEIDTRNSKVLPQRGIYWITEASGYNGMDENAKNYIKLKSDIRFYLSFTADPRVVFAFRIGGAVNIGGYEFYQANFLGGRTNLRGFRSNRFAGDQSFYQSTEIRFKLLNLKSYIFNGQTGFYLFNDLGRVWVDDENSTRWHDGYGFGVWVTPFEFTALTFSYNLSYDDKLFVLGFKFLF